MDLLASILKNKVTSFGMLVNKASVLEAKASVLEATS